jgi:hypothetical protein
MGFPVTNDFPSPLYIGRLQYNFSALTAVNNRAYYIPVSLHRTTSFTNMQWRSGAPVGNYDIGIYDRNFRRLFSTGLLAVGADNTPALAATLSPGQYYLALLITDGLCQIRSMRNNTPGSVWVEVPSASPLPLQAAPVESSSNVELVPAIIAYR